MAEGNGEPTAGRGEPRVSHHQVRNKLCELYEELFRYPGCGEMHLEIRFRNRGQKEVIIRCGKQYRFIVDYRNGERRRASLPYEGDDRRKAAPKDSSVSRTGSSGTE